jgi:hypothetical protein
MPWPDQQDPTSASALQHEAYLPYSAMVSKRVLVIKEPSAIFIPISRFRRRAVSNEEDTHEMEVTTLSVSLPLLLVPLALE